MDKIGVFSLQKSLFCGYHSLIFIIWPSNASNSTNTRLEKEEKTRAFRGPARSYKSPAQVSALEDGFGALHLCHPDLGETHEATVTSQKDIERREFPKTF